mmetsp:Transcript_82462/g.229856  ORF Transcript_82462/g.229856 Transcript_82462/m.229856 type:complete len:139 (+) Transcript_82462:2237-2653(+)
MYFFVCLKGFDPVGGEGGMVRGEQARGGSVRKRDPGGTSRGDEVRGVREVPLHPSAHPPRNAEASGNRGAPGSRVVDGRFRRLPFQRTAKLEQRERVDAGRVPFAGACERPDPRGEQESPTHASVRRDSVRSHLKEMA